MKMVLVYVLMIQFSSVIVLRMMMTIRVFLRKSRGVLLLFLRRLLVIRGRWRRNLLLPWILLVRLRFVRIRLVVKLNVLIVFSKLPLLITKLIILILNIVKLLMKVIPMSLVMVVGLGLRFVLVINLRV